VNQRQDGEEEKRPLFEGDGWGFGLRKRKRKRRVVSQPLSVCGGRRFHLGWSGLHEPRKGAAERGTK